MKSLMMLLFSAFVVVGCSKEGDRGDKTASSKPSAVEPDNTGKNVRDRSESAKTAGDQSENEADRKITQEIRKTIVADDKLSTSAQNVKIVTNDGKVTLRGPVKTAAEKAKIAQLAAKEAGKATIDNQLDIKETK